jgi:hypothetical protein
MEVGCHISVYNMEVGCHNCLREEPFFNLSYFVGCFAKKLSRKFFISVYMKVWLFHETLQPKYGNLFGRLLFKIVDTQAS